MGTRGAFGVIIGEQEKIGYNQFDSYPSGKGIENLRWLREQVAQGIGVVKQQAIDCRLVDDSSKPTLRDIKALAGATDLNVSRQSTDDWYCLTRNTHGDIGAMLQSGYIYDNHLFPLDSLFCEWAYIVDFDRDVFEMYVGFQKELPKRGRWAGRPTAEEDVQAYRHHIEWCKENNRDPWQPPVSEYKAVELIGSWPFSDLPHEDTLLTLERQDEEALV